MTAGTIASGYPRDGDIARLAEAAMRPSVESAVAGVRELLEIDVAYATEFSGGIQVFRALKGDGAGFGLDEGSEFPLEETYCQRILAGEMPELVNDMGSHPLGSTLPVTEAAGVGAYASVPITFADGRFYGTLCVASHAPREDLTARDLEFMRIFARIIADQLEREISIAERHHREIQTSTVEALVTAIEARDHYTSVHSEAVVGLALGIATRLGYRDTELADVRTAALLHDVGKIAIPDEILQKPEPLSDEEWKQMRLHPVHGERIVATIPGLSHLAPVVRAEHERWDGAGYPDGLAGVEIPEISRIVFVADAYHAMRSDRAYRKAIPVEAAQAELVRCRATQFCPRAVDALLAILLEEGDVPV